MNENSLKDIFIRSKPIWEPIFTKYLYKEQVPDFSIYRKPYDMQMRKQYHNDHGTNSNDKCKFNFIFLFLFSTPYPLYEI